MDNYLEPFFGSGAVLFLRPKCRPNRIETVNDSDGLLANFWRALKYDPDGVARHADWPVSECDKHARHLWLVNRREKITDKLCGDPKYFNSKAAGWWVWGINCWIGGGWCNGDGPWVSENGVMVKRKDQGEIRIKGQGINRTSTQRRCEATTVSRGQTGINRQLPELGSGKGVNRPSIRHDQPHSDHAGKRERRLEALKEYLGEIADRLRDVRVCCGDWTRVCVPSGTYINGLTGVFLDPPYSNAGGERSEVYAKEDLNISHAVREWAIEQGKNPLMRICLAGYEGEHDMPSDWRVEKWKARGGFGNQSDDPESQGRVNSEKERLWFSPFCLSGKKRRSLLDDLAPQR